MEAYQPKIATLFKRRKQGIMCLFIASIFAICFCVYTYIPILPFKTENFIPATADRNSIVASIDKPMSAVYTWEAYESKAESRNSTGTVGPLPQMHRISIVESSNKAMSAVYTRGTYGRKDESRNPVGTVWPLPQTQRTSANSLNLKPDEFSFDATNHTCDILEIAFKRFLTLIFNPPRPLKATTILGSKEQNYKGSFLSSLQVSLNNSCEKWPSSTMKEKYELKIDTEDLRGKALLQSESVWGILRGLETFSQLVYLNENGQFQVNGTHIVDFPRFKYRGLMLDTGRHYLSKKLILENLEAMAQNKFNVFHWHVVDDPSFPFQSKSFPLLSEKGSFNPETRVYTPEDVAEIVEFARLRGIRVIPEFDTPGHTTSWAEGMPDILTPCYSDGKEVKGRYGPVNPALNSTYQNLKTFFAEIANVFPDKYVHIGGDEVDVSCWKTNPQVSAFMKKMNFNANKLEEYYITNLLKVFPDNTSFIVWHDVINEGVNVEKEAVVQVWNTDYKSELKLVTSKGYQAILSSCWYLDETKGNYFWDWDKLYKCEPQDFGGTEQQTRLVIGGEACMWGESVDGTNMITRVWPRASAIAERLWSAKSTTNTDSALPRLAEHRCRMLVRGINAEPQPGPSYCNVDLNKL